MPISRVGNHPYYISNYISDNEKDGDISLKLLTIFNRFIGALRSYFHIHCFCKGKHSKSSYHYKDPCEAGDGHIGKFVKSRKPTDQDIDVIALNLRKLINKEKKSIFEQAILAKLSGFSGIGMYPDWNPRSGLHLDIRDHNKSVIWIGLNKDKLQKKINETDGNQVYVYLI